MRLIDGDELAKRIKEEGNHQYYALCNMEATHNYADCYSKVLSAPTIDAGPIVRCRDCKYWDEKYSFCINTEKCFGGETTPDWFCASGEREDNADE